MLEDLFLKSFTKDADFSKSTLIALEIDGDRKSVDEVDVKRGDEVLSDHSGKQGSICFVVRRPG